MKSVDFKSPDSFDEFTFGRSQFRRNYGAVNVQNTKRKWPILVMVSNEISFSNAFNLVGVELTGISAFHLSHKLPVII